MLPVDLVKFWADDSLAHEHNCFNPAAPQVALGIRMSDECVFAELGEKGDPWGHTPRERRIELNKRYNDKAEQTVGIRLLREDYPTEDMLLPPVKRIGQVFGGSYTLGENTGEWLHSEPMDAVQLSALLDSVEKLDLREFMLPPSWESEKKRVFEQYGIRPSQMRHVRGPVTLAMSIFGTEPLIFLHYDAPELFERFSRVITDVIIKMADIMDVEAGYTKETAPRFFSFADDNCCLLTAEMYEVFGYPVLRDVFARFAPEKDDTRYQHSDSDMGHLLPLLAKVNLNGCNFGPNVLVDSIRKYMPDTRIDGCLAPFTFMNNNTDEIIAEVKRDCEMIKRTGTKGLNLTTAGSINNGSSLESMRTVMHAIQEYGRRY